MELVKATETPKKKSPTPKLEVIKPTMIVEVWKLFERSLKEGLAYPDLSEEQPEVIRHHLFQYLNQPSTVGLLAKLGRKPVGMILGNIQSRPYGKPRNFCIIWVAWVEPEYRRKGIMSLLYRDFFAKLKKAGIFHWESFTSPEVTKILINHKGSETRVLSDRVGGKC